MNIKSVGYMGIGASDPVKWLAYGVDVIGMMPARAIPGQGWGVPQHSDLKATDGVGPDGSVYLKMDERQWRLAIHPTLGREGLLYLGLEVEDKYALERSVQELAGAGIEVSVGTEAQAFARSVSGIAYLRDPAGNALELYYGPVQDYKFHSPVGGQEFVAGHLGIGHMNIFVEDLEANYNFYTRVLGFQLSDYIRMGPDSALKFMRCNERHHSIAIIGMGDVNGLQHAMFEMQTIDDVGKALDRALAAGITITSSLGRHRNDGMLSFYMRSPSGFDVEIGCGCLLIDDSWTVNEFCEGDVWGHHGLVDAVMASCESLRTVDE
ncbi:MAG: VOC family protein [Halieaceae bacterium]|uniref:VOC family protein n=1 Tax=Haliea alexandrii TaxID=2448162 RepID=UPI000F0B8321|nr:VOC family protein [Haliea alexandrii]MCR9184190.1 VOC family protein [Halieaceae bacterium]